MEAEPGNGFKAALRVLHGKGTQLVRTVKPGPPQAFALRTADGGAPSLERGDPHDAARPALRADDGTFATRPRAEGLVNAASAPGA